MPPLLSGIGCNSGAVAEMPQIAADSQNSVSRTLQNGAGIHWRDEYGTGANYVEVTTIRQQAAALVEAWPRELAAPVVDTVEKAWASAEKPALSHAALAPLRDALKHAQAIAAELATLKLEMVSGDSEICELAERCARMCGSYPAAAEFIVQRAGLEIPQGKRITPEGALLRMQCPRWWRRSLRRHYGRAVESAMRARGHVQKRKALYCTDWALRRRQSQKHRQRAMLSEAIAINETGQQFTLQELADKSVSNPELRRHELMTRIAGMEQLAKERGEVAIFATLTAPSLFHATLNSGRENPLYIAAGKPSVAQAQEWLCRQWARARARLHRLGVVLSGFRVAEPHHDGTPHWHGLFFVAADQEKTLRHVIKSVWLAEHGSEPGARKHRAKFVKIDAARGSAAGYVAKYVAKNIDGFNVGADYEAIQQDTSNTAARVEAWAATHRIRQFQQIGGARVGIWRECRRAEAGLLVGVLQNACVCADSGDWAGFTKAAPGIELWKEEAGECNQYRELKAAAVIGVQAGIERIRTRIHEWVVSWSGSEKSARPQAAQLGVLSITVRDTEKTPPTAPPSPWMIVKQGKKWVCHRAFSTAPPIIERSLHPAYQFIQSVTYQGALTYGRH